MSNLRALAFALSTLAPSMALAQTPGTPPAEATLGAESPALAAMREAEREADRAPGAGTLAQAAEQAGLTLESYGLDAEFAARLQMPAFQRRLTPRIAREIGLMRTDERARRMLVDWLRHAARFRSRMEAILMAEGVPSELVWVVAAESDFSTGSTSSVGAGGPWQLMPDAARQYGLRVDNWVDERRDPERSTRAAARYLSDLHDRFGAWDLALAAYNMGYNALLRSIRKYNSNDFETLSELEAGLPWETIHYAPRIIASAIAARSFDVFALGPIEYVPAASWEDVAVARSLSLADIARAAHVAGVDEARLRALNPSLLRTRTPLTDGAAPFMLHVPVGSFMQVREAVARLPDPRVRGYVLKYGESHEEVAARYGISPSALLSLSGSPDARTIAPGTLLLTPDRDPSARAVDELPVVPMDPSQRPGSGQHRVYVRTAAADDVATAARALGVTPANLCLWNSLDPGARLQSGMWLQAFVVSDPPGVRVWQESEVEAVRRGSDVFLDDAARREGLVRIHVTVRAGETFATLADRFSSTVGRIARINQRDRNAALTPGESIVVYTTPSHVNPPVDPAAPPSSAASAAPVPPPVAAPRVASP